MKAVDVPFLFVYWLLCTWQDGSQTPEEAPQMQQHILDMYVLYMTLDWKESQAAASRQLWVRPIFTRVRRLLQGPNDNLLQEMACRDKMKYLNYVRMCEKNFKKPLQKIMPYIQKQHVVCVPIPPYSRLHICLRYLASRDSMQLLAFAFRVGSNTVSKIIQETCAAIWQALKFEYFPESSTQRWYDNAINFEDKWDFRHCLGVIDGKFVTMQVIIMFINFILQFQAIFLFTCPNLYFNCSLNDKKYILETVF